LSGLMWVAIVVAVFVLWHFLPQQKGRPAQSSPKFRNDLRVSPAHDQWQRVVEEHCESPAEVAFLRAMISACDLRPEKGSLAGDGMRLDLQVEESRYRVDFLVDRWLVVEIDGAAYHSSPEAVARDQRRDQELEALGYTILRIPARRVFNQPIAAVADVRAALKVGKREVPAPVIVPSESNGFFRLGRTLSSVGRAAREMNDFESKARATQLALAQAKQAADLERAILDAAIEGAKRRVELDDWLREDPARAASYEVHHARFRALFPLKEDGPVAVHRIEFLPPTLTGNPDIDLAIENGFASLSDERRKLEQSTQQTLSQEPGLRAQVQQTLKSTGWEDLWDRIR